MNKIYLFLLCLPLIIVFNDDVSALTISQCIQPDGSIEFTNQGCSKSNRLQAKRTYNRNFTNSSIKRYSSKKRKQHLFKHPSFVKLQKSLINAKSSTEMEKLAQKITKKVNNSARNGQLGAAYNMVAATYAKLSKVVKRKKWEGKSIDSYTYKIQTLFEHILISQSTTSTASELTKVIQSAWKVYQTDS